MNKFSYYCLSILFAVLLPFHMLNSIAYDGVKLFYFPVAGLALYGICKLLPALHSNTILRIFGGFVFLSFFSAIYGGVDAFLLSVSILLIFFTIVGVESIDKDLFLKLFPVIFLLAIYYSFEYSGRENSLYRFQGLYNDPNYLVLSLLVGIYILIKSFLRSGLMGKGICIITILYAIYAIMLTQSRGGIIALGILFLGVLITGLIHARKQTIIVLVSIIFFSSSLFVRYAENIENITVRFKAERAGDASSTASRFKEAEAAINSMEKNPGVLFFGAGVGVSGDPTYSRSLGYTNFSRVHVTPVAILYENGFIALLLYIVIVFSVILQTYKSRKIIEMGLVLAIVAQSMTIWIVPYLPFWMGVFLVVPKNKAVSRILHDKFER